MPLDPPQGRIFVTFFWLILAFSTDFSQMYECLIFLSGEERIG